MLATSIIALLSSAGVTFYARFLVALFSEFMSHAAESQKALRFRRRTRPQTLYWKTGGTRAATPILELNPNTNLNAAERTVI